MTLPSSRFVVLIVLVSLVGCGGDRTGPERAAVKGRVTLDGQDIEKGSITFRPAPGTKGMTAGGAITNGRFEISAERGPVVGKTLIEIHAPRKSGRKVQAPMSAPGTLTDEYVEAVAPQFNKDTTVERDVVSGENTYDLKVESK